MSFIKKAVKKVFKVVKKIVKSKIFKIAAVAALTFFTAGVASAGFAAFEGVSTVGGFFSAVGSTISAGFTGTVGALFGAPSPAAGAGVLDPVAATATKIGGVATPGAAEFAAMGGVQAGGAASAGLAMGATQPVVGSIGQHLANTAAKEGSKSLLSRIFGSIMAPTTAGSMMRTGLMMGAQAWMQNDAMKDAKKYRDSRNVWGSPAFGGDGTGWDLMAPVAAPKPVAQAGQPEALLTPDQFGASTQQAGGAPPPPQLPEGQNVARAESAGLLQPPSAAPTSQPPPPAPGGRGPAYDPYGGVKV